MILQEILEHKRQEVAARQESMPLEEVRARAAKAASPRPFATTAPMSLIAEVKRRSPSAGDIAAGADPVAQALAYERGGAAAISVLTDNRFFGGSLDDLAGVHAVVSIPVLCK